MPLTPEERKVIAPWLLAPDLARDPESFKLWRETNLLVRALAHLMGKVDGKSVPLIATAAGVLQTLPPWLADAATGTDSDAVAADGVYTVDFGSAAARLVMVSVDASVGRCYDSTSSGGCNTPLANVSLESGPILLRTACQYFDVHALAAMTMCMVQYWDL